MQVFNNLDHFFIIFLAIERNDRYPILQIECKRINIIINNKDIFRIDIFKYTQIFNEKLYSSPICAWVVYVSALISEKTVLDKFPTRVKLVNYRICIPVIGGCVNCNFEMLVCLFKAFKGIRAHRKTCLISITILWINKFYISIRNKIELVRVLWITILIRIVIITGLGIAINILVSGTMYQSLVKIKYKELCESLFFKFKVYFLFISKLRFLLYLLYVINLAKNMDCHVLIHLCTKTIISAI